MKLTSARLVAPALLLAALAVRPVLLAAPVDSGSRLVPIAALVSLAAAGPELPDSPAGRCAADFLANLGEATLKSVKAFEEKWASKKRLAARTMQERAESLAENRDAWAGAKVMSASARGDDLVVSVKLKNGDTADLEFHFDADEPGKLEYVMIAMEQGGGGGGKALPPLTAADRAASIKAACVALRDGYVYPEVAEKMAASVLAKLEKGGYDAITTDRELAAALTEDFRAVSKDMHLRVRAEAGAMTSAPAGDAEDGPSEAQRTQMRARNFAFQKVEILPGNIGYLRFDAFVNDAEAEATAAGAMAFLQHCDAIIYDLRSNGGGSPEMIAFLTTYLFESKTHLNNMIDRTGKVVEEFWTRDSVPGAKLKSGIPVFVLTSKRTFSGAEEFSYNLQNLKRGTIVGETTGGGAHPVRPERVNERLVIGMPFMRANNPISKTNWEGTGVKPDVATPAGEALEKAIELARAAIKKGK